MISKIKIKNILANPLLYFIFLILALTGCKDGGGAARPKKYDINDLINEASEIQEIYSIHKLSETEMIEVGGLMAKIPKEEWGKLRDVLNKTGKLITKEEWELLVLGKGPLKVKDRVQKLRNVFNAISQMPHKEWAKIRLLNKINQFITQAEWEKIHNVSNKCIQITQEEWRNMFDQMTQEEWEKLNPLVNPYILRQEHPVRE